jgi:hypothetical protein
MSIFGFWSELPASRQDDFVNEAGKTEMPAAHQDRVSIEGATDETRIEHGNGSRRKSMLRNPKGMEIAGVMGSGGSWVEASGGSSRNHRLVDEPMASVR